MGDNLIVDEGENGTWTFPATVRLLPVEAQKRFGAAISAPRKEYVRADLHAAVTAERDALREKLTEWETKLSAVMPHDFKDWHKNNPDEWPEIAVMVIKNLRKQLELTEAQLDD
jgi:hypothetical protein